LNCFSLTRVSEPTRTRNQARGGGTGGRSDRDDEGAISSMSLSRPSGEKIKAPVGAKNNESPTVQPGQHAWSCDLTGSLPLQSPRSPAMCAQQLIRCRGGCGISARTGRVTATIDKARIKTKQRDNAVITYRS
jgi:hypothetical protein